jgi:hypothetical protein
MDRYAPQAVGFRSDESDALAKLTIGSGAGNRTEDNMEANSSSVYSQGRDGNPISLSRGISPLNGRLYSVGYNLEAKELTEQIEIDHRDDPNEEIENTFGQGFDAGEAAKADQGQNEGIFDQILTFLADLQGP